MGLTNVDVQIATPEPRSVIFCALLAVGICGVERRRLREMFLKNGKWKMENGKCPLAGRFDGLRVVSVVEPLKVPSRPKDSGPWVSEARRNGKMEDENGGKARRSSVNGGAFAFKPRRPRSLRTIRRELTASACWRF